jgi:hypothetical protein
MGQKTKLKPTLTDFLAIKIQARDMLITRIRCYHVRFVKGLDEPIYSFKSNTFQTRIFLLKTVAGFPATCFGIDTPKTNRLASSLVYLEGVDIKCATTAIQGFFANLRRC